MALLSGAVSGIPQNLSVEGDESDIQILHRGFDPHFCESRVKHSLLEKASAGSLDF